MKKLFFYVIMSIVAVSAYADATITIPNVQIKSGKSAVLAVTLSGDQTRFSIGWDITLASGLTIKDKNDLKNGEIAPDLSPLINTAGAPVYKIGATSSTEWTASDGVLQYITIYDDGSHNVGDVLTCSIDNIELGNGVAAEALHPAGSTFNVTVVADVLDLYDTDMKVPVTTQEENVVLHRNFKGGMWNTFVVPFDMNASQITEAFGAGAQVAELDEASKTGDVIEVGFVTVTGITANTPCIVKPNADLTEIRVNNVPAFTASEDPDDLTVNGGPSKKKYFNIVGTYKPITIARDIEDDFYPMYISNNKFYYAKDGTTVKGYRAYFDFYQWIEDAENAVKLLVDMDGETFIDGINAGAANGKAYTVDGKYVGKDVKLNRMQKGVYIVNGKKVVNK